MNINFELYKVFYEVANTKSISKGAEKLLVSQPAVTQSIQTLENELGGKLFVRTPKGVVLTNEGQIFYDYIKEGMNYFINGTNKFMSLKELNEGILNIGATATISEHFLIPYLKKFHELYPNIKINITNGLTHDLIKDLRNGNLDIIVTAIPDNNIKDISITYLKDLNDIFVGNSEYKEKVYNDLNSLFKENILLQKSPSVTRDNFDKYLKDNNLVCESFMEIVSHNLLIKMTENGFGIALLTREFIDDKIENTLFEIKTPITIPKRKLGYAIKNNSVPSFTTKRFIELLEKN